MKKFGLLALTAVLLLSACNRNEEEVVQPSPTATSVDAQHFYGVKRSENAGGTMERQGVAQKTNLWYPCSTITVKFLNDPYNMKEMVKATAKQWEQYAGITFNFVESGDAFVRIGFDWNEDRTITWSYIGTDCKNNTNQNDATVSFAYWDSSTEQERKADVLRAFGQVLGLELEHRHLSFEAGWTSKISQYWTGEMSDLTWENLKKYVFDQLDAANVIQTATYDASSIMIWPFSSKYASKTSRSFNYELSAQDIAFIGQLYPKNACDDGAIVTMKTSKQSVSFTVSNSSDIIVDWGDGIRETLLKNSFNDNVIVGTDLQMHDIAHSYVSNGEHMIKFYGTTDAIAALLCYWSDLTMLDISKNTRLSLLSCGNNLLNTLDVSKNTQLEKLYCGGASLTTIDVSNNLLLKELECGYCQLTNLNLSRNTKLEFLYCGGNNFTGLDVSNNLLLSVLECRNCHLTQLNLTKNVQLNSLRCDYNEFSTLDVSKNKELLMLYCTNNKLTRLDISQNTKLGYLYCESNYLTQLDVSQNLNLAQLHCRNNQISNLIASPTGSGFLELEFVNNPFVANQTVMMQLVQSLPDRSTGGLTGKLYLANSTSASWIASICAAKNWVIY